MIKHLVLWKFTAGLKPDDFAAIAEGLSKDFGEMAAVIPGMLSAEVGLNLAPDSEYALILSAHFTDMAALAVYQDHPLHLAVKEKMKNHVDGRAVFDYLSPTEKP